MTIEITVTVETLRKRKLFLGLPCYGGMMAAITSRSLSDLTAVCCQYGIELKTYYLMNESLVQRARNYCVDEFLRSDCTHMMFIDSDIGFNAQDVITMLAMMSDDSPYDILCGPYPKKCIPYEKLVQAVNAGYADNDPNKLEDLIGDFVFNVVEGTQSFQLSEPVEVLESGTGFMMIRRNTFDVFKEAYPQQSYKPDHVRTAAFDGSREIIAYFDCPIDPESKRYLSEDYMFCQWSRKAGLKVWLCPWIELQHMGSLVFGGKLSAMAAVGSSPTADASLLKNKK